MIERIRTKLVTGQPARPVDYFMLGVMLVMIVMLATLYMRGVRCIA